MTVNSVEERILAAARYKLNMDEKVIQAGKFDQKSTGSERQQLLHSILHQDNAYDEEESEIPEDENINDMIFRSDEELEIFQKMDLERKLQDEREGLRSRLLTEEDLPDWLRKDDEEVDRWAYEEDEELLGRGSRQRKEVDYTNSQTEKELLEAIYDDGVEYEEEEQDDKKKKKTKKRKKKGDEGDEPVRKSRRGWFVIILKIEKVVGKLINVVTDGLNSKRKITYELTFYETLITACVIIRRYLVILLLASFGVFCINPSFGLFLEYFYVAIMWMDRKKRSCLCHCRIMNVI